MSQHTRHTPGPWKVDGLAIVGQRYVASVKDWSTFPCAKQYKTINNALRREAKANARLIAAAPEMLEALKQAQTFIRTLKREYCPDPIPPNSDSGLDWDTQLAIHNAIAQAEGRTEREG